ncbi:MAG: PBP1A family penicillin-binding protein [Nitrospirae bacterium]|nr:PBP1A family penicillin-binding protein [Nitrospirota bacterium]
MRFNPFSSALSKLLRHKILIRLLVVAGVLGVVGVVAVAGAVWKLSHDLPDISHLKSYSPSSVTRIYDINNDLLGEYYNERREYVPLERIPAHLIHAVLAVEDSRFYSHIGVDVVRIGGAVVANFVQGGFSQGGSTITQQLARTLFLSREKTLSRKLKEAILSIRMEQLLTKDRILELYLNEIYLGNGAYGVEAAAQAYFGKGVDQITLPEAAFLAGLPKAPSRYTPYADPKAAKQRQGVVLRRMVDEGAIPWADYQAAYAADLSFRRPQSAARSAPYVLEEVRQHLAARYGNGAVYNGGLSVYTAIDGAMQEAAELAVKHGLRELDKRQGWRGVIGTLGPAKVSRLRSKAPRARIHTDLVPENIYEAVVLEVFPDQVTVLVEGREGTLFATDMQWARRRLNGPDIKNDVVVHPTFDPQHQLAPGDMIHVGLKTISPLTFRLEQVPVAQAALVALDPATGEVRAMVGGYDFGISQFNRAVSAKRQPGSAFKPVVYAAAFDRGYGPASIMMDTPLVFRDATGVVWKPENYEMDFSGPISLRNALVHSRNVATIKLVQEMGVRPVQQFARRVGINSELASNLSLSLGSSSVSVMELTRAYAVFASGGQRAEPYLIRRVVDRDGTLLEGAEPQVKRVVSEETAYLITNVMEDVIRDGTGRKARALKAHIGGKTGTTNNFTDAWFVGASPNLAVGVWVGMDNHTPLGIRETGARAALPIWVEFMRTALQQVPDTPFNIPKGIVYARIDPRTGLLAQDGEGGVVEVFARRNKPKRAARSEVAFEEFVEMDKAPRQR